VEGGEGGEQGPGFDLPRGGLGSVLSPRVGGRKESRAGTQGELCGKFPTERNEGVGPEAVGKKEKKPGWEYSSARLGKKGT